MSEVTHIARFPLKSGKAEVLESAALSPQGIALDREFMIARFSDDAWRQFTQRNKGGEKLAVTTLEEKNDCFAVNAPSMPELKLPKSCPETLKRDVYVHTQLTQGLDLGDDASEWVSTVFGDSADLASGGLRLLRQDPTFIRKPNAGFVSDLNARTAFADGYPILLINNESLQLLSEKVRSLEPEISLPNLRDRMRGNICVSALEGAFSEDRIKLIKIGDGLILELVKPCSRCGIPAINQDTADIDNTGRAILKALGEFRRGHQLGLSSTFPAFDAAELNKTFFGMNAIVHNVGSGRVAINDKVEILERY